MSILVRFRFVFDIFYVFYLEYSNCRLGFPLVLVLFDAVFTVYVPFPFGVWERMQNRIVLFRLHVTVQNMFFVFQSLNLKMMSVNKSYSIRLIGQLYQRVLTNEMINERVKASLTFKCMTEHLFINKYPVVENRKNQPTGVLSGI